jgi:mannose-6-phosphate isomerase
LHAIGEGNLIVEVQQNSDTTYRVFDWNRTGLDGAPRTLHIEESLRSIDFLDFEATVAPATAPIIADCPYFRVERIAVERQVDPRPTGRFAIIAVVAGVVSCGSEVMPRGSVVLLPASDQAILLEPCEPDTQILVVTLPT